MPFTYTENTSNVNPQASPLSKVEGFFKNIIPSKQKIASVAPTVGAIVGQGIGDVVGGLAGGTAGTVVEPGGGTALGAIGGVKAGGTIGAGIGGSVGKWLQNKLTGQKQDPKSIATEGVTDAAAAATGEWVIGPATSWATKGVGKLMTKVGGNVATTGIDEKLSADFTKNTGKDLQTFIKENNLYGATSGKVNSLIDEANKRYTAAVDRASTLGKKISLDKVEKAYQKRIAELRSEGPSASKSIADKLEQEFNGIKSSLSGNSGIVNPAELPNVSQSVKDLNPTIYGKKVGKVSPRQLLDVRRATDKYVKSFEPGNVADVSKESRTVLKGLIDEATKGETDVLGTRIDHLNEFYNTLDAHLSKVSDPITSIIKKLMTGGGAGAVLGVGAGIKKGDSLPSLAGDALMGYTAQKVITNPTVLKNVSESLIKNGNKLNPTEYSKLMKFLGGLGKSSASQGIKNTISPTLDNSSSSNFTYQ